MNLFIDTNIYLNLYHLTDDDLEELKKLLVLIDKGMIILYLPMQVKDEFIRNREGKINEALKGLNDKKIDGAFSRICQSYDEYELLMEDLKQFNIHKQAIIFKIKKDIAEMGLKADLLIEKLFCNAKCIDIDDFVVLADKRVKLGNPPGKNGSIGDAVNWESLLGSIPLNQNLHFITNDEDYVSKLSYKSDDINEFLKREWGEKKKSKLFFYRNLSEFFKKYFPDIKLADELDRTLSVIQLISSESFAKTHLVISKLNSFSDFTDFEIQSIVEAGLDNSQIYSIGKDKDVNDFMNKIIKDKMHLFDKETIEKFANLYAYNDPEK